MFCKMISAGEIPSTGLTSLFDFIAASRAIAVELQTKRTRFRAFSGPIESIDLFSVVHYADASYYDDLNKALSHGYDAVYFECITAMNNVSTNPLTTLRTLRQKVGPSPAACSEAKAIGAVPQMSMLNFHSDQNNFYVADLSTEELKSAPSSFDGEQRPNPKGQPQRSLRIAESSLRLLRALCFLLPCPELAVLFVDFIQPDSGAAVLPRAPVFLFALLRGDVRAARRVLFSLVVEATTAQRANSRVEDLATRRRNLRVLECIRAGGDLGLRNVAVVYGAWHGDNLGRLFEKNLEMDFDSSSWQTALVAENERDGVTWAPFWSRVVASADNSMLKLSASEDSAQPPVRSVLALLAVLGCLAGASGLDYLSTVSMLTRLVEKGSDDGIAVAVVSYFARHAPTYFFLRQWLLQGGLDRM